MPSRRCAVLALVLLALPGALVAQASANVQATANVLAQISLAGQQDLQFGDVIPGFAKSVVPSDANAGRFLVSGAGSYEVSLGFTLPTDLSDGGSNLLPISFGAASAGYGSTAASVSSTFDPTVGTNANLVGGQLYVFIGGTVTPAGAQAAGSYSGTITLTVAYTGN